MQSTILLTEYTKELSGLLKTSTVDDRPAMASFGEYMLVRTGQLFESGQRDGVKWAPLTPKTIESRQNAGYKGTQPLNRTGALKGSIKFRVVKQIGLYVTRVYTRQFPAGIQHRGASIPAHEIRPKRAKALRFVSGGKVIFAKKVTIPAFKIPARPILFFSERDRRTAIDHIRKGRIQAIKRTMPRARVIA